MYTLFTGFLYGGTNVVVGHPTDTIKTKMQAQAGHFESQKSWTKIAGDVYAEQGVRGFYKGALPPFFGSCVYRSTRYAVSDAVFMNLEDHKWFGVDIPYMGGIQGRTFLGGIAAGSFRAFIECPFEYSKVRGQTNQKWVFSESYKGFSAIYPRCVGLLTAFICQLHLCRKHTNLMDTKTG